VTLPDSGPLAFAELLDTADFAAKIRLLPPPTDGVGAGFGFAVISPEKDFWELPSKDGSPNLFWFAPAIAARTAIWSGDA
jgi:hypothetical protein